MLLGQTRAGAGTGPTRLTAAEAVAVADVLALDANGEAVLASATYASNRWAVLGVALEAAAPTAAFFAQTGEGVLVPTRFASAPLAADRRKPVFLDTVNGRATLTPSSASGVIRFLLGYLQDADGLTTTPTVLYSPTWISLIP